MANGVAAMLGAADPIVRHWFELFNEWRKAKLSERQFVYVLAITIGVLSGFIALLLANTVKAVEWVITKSFFIQSPYALYLVYPVVGILLTQWFIRRIIKQPITPGIPNTLHAISKKNGMIKKHNLYSSIVAASLTVSFGGSTGLEGPTVGTTTAWGSSLGTLFRLPFNTRVLLIGCAAAGAMSALFNAPVAALVFAIEVIMLDLTTASMVPLLLASASASITSHLFLGDELLFHFSIRDELKLVQLPYYVGLGVFTGVVSIYFFKAYVLVNKLFDKLPRQRTRTLVAAPMLGLMLFVMPPLFGQGYDSINAIIEGRAFDMLDNSLFADQRGNQPLLIALVLGLALAKVIATTLTFRAGGVGGTFAPTLFIGAMAGFFFARAVNYFELGAVPESNFVLVAMAGLMAGNLHAPLTAIFLIAEITGGYSLFVPLMVVSSIAFVTVKQFNAHSIYTTQLARRGELITHDKDQAVLTLMKLYREIETDFVAVGPYDTLGDLVKVIARSSRNLFPVLDEQKRFLGVVNMNEVKHVIFDNALYETTYVHELMNDAPEFVRKQDSMEAVMAKFEQCGAWNLPVIDDNGCYLGFVSKSKLFSAYRSQLKDFYGQ